jgi:hypothetical protein
MLSARGCAQTERLWPTGWRGRTSVRMHVCARASGALRFGLSDRTHRAAGCYNDRVEQRFHPAPAKKPSAPAAGTPAAHPAPALGRLEEL